MAILTPFLAPGAEAVALEGHSLDTVHELELFERGGFYTRVALLEDSTTGALVLLQDSAPSERHPFLAPAVPWEAVYFDTVPEAGDAFHATVAELSAKQQGEDAEDF